MEDDTRETDGESVTIRSFTIGGTTFTVRPPPPRDEVPNPIAPGIYDQSGERIDRGNPIDIFREVYAQAGLEVDEESLAQARRAIYGEATQPLETRVTEVEGMVQSEASAITNLSSSVTLGANGYVTGFTIGDSPVSGFSPMLVDANWIFRPEPAIYREQPYRPALEEAMAEEYAIPPRKRSHKINRDEFSNTSRQLYEDAHQDMDAKSFEELFETDGTVDFAGAEITMPFGQTMEADEATPVVQVEHGRRFFRWNDGTYRSWAEEHGENDRRGEAKVVFRNWTDIVHNTYSLGLRLLKINDNPAVKPKAVSRVLDV